MTKPTDLVAIAEGPDGLLRATNPRAKVLVDYSTTDIASAEHIATILTDLAGMPFVDVPVSGGPAATEGDTLAIMAGDRDGDTCDGIPRSIHPCGAVRAGQATKLVNQTLALTNYCVMAENLRSAEAYGVDAPMVPHALATGNTGSNMLPVMFERVIDRDCEPHGDARQILKDLERLSEAAGSKKVPMSAQALSLFHMMGLLRLMPQSMSLLSITFWA